MSRAFERFVYGSRTAAQCSSRYRSRCGRRSAVPSRACRDVRVIGNGVDINAVRARPDAPARWFATSWPPKDDFHCPVRRLGVARQRARHRDRGTRNCATCHLVVVGDGDATEARRRAEATRRRGPAQVRRRDRPSPSATTQRRTCSSCPAPTSRSRSRPSRPRRPASRLWRPRSGAIPELIEAEAAS